MELFSSPSNAPLAERMRPQSLDEIVGQEKLLRENSPFRLILQSGRIPSMIFWGPPGVGKTTLAQIIAKTANKPFKQLSAIQAGVKDIREVIEFAKKHLGTILFIDEIHRFNKSQQDALLGAVEKGVVVLIGATTENPSFEVNAALLSRCQVYSLESLSQAEVANLLEKAIKTDAVLSTKSIELQETEALYLLGGGDGRKTLSLLEIVVNAQSAAETVVITDEIVMRTAQEHIALYDKSGEQHYDIISAFIKSVRGSDAQAAVYWLARMLDGGEDVEFIARRMIILASEDIGNANPNALLLATSAFQSVRMIGMPEARIILSQVATYLAVSEKSNASYVAINDALDFVRQSPPLPVPLHLRNAPTKLMKDMDYGKNYKYSHNFVGKDGNQLYLPEQIAGKVFYRPKNIGNEIKIKKNMEDKWGDSYKLEG